MKIENKAKPTSMWMYALYFFVAISGISIFCLYSFLLYKDIFKSVDDVDKNIKIYIIIASCIIALYLIISIFICIRNPSDLEIIGTYKPSSKKVKDMTSIQKKNRKTAQEAKSRYSFYTCGYWKWKIFIFISLISSYSLYPYVKKEKKTHLFILLFIFSIPSILLLTIGTMVLLYLASKGNYYYY